MPESSDTLPKGVVSLRIPEQKVFQGQAFPLVLSPESSLKDKDHSYWVQWSRDNVDQLKALLHQYGAILFRGFPIDEPVHFDLFAKAFGWEEFPYVGGVSVRKPMVGNVYTSTESPPDRKICYHHEMAHVEDHPKRLFFYCDIPSPEGGETPIVLSHEIYRLMAEREPEFVQRLEAEGLIYVRVAPEENDVSSALGRSWKSTFFAENKEEAEINAKKTGFNIEWMEGNEAKTVTNVLSAIRVNQETGRKIWFNSSLTCYKAWEDDRNDRTRSVVFPNGDQMPSAAIDTLEKTADEVGVAFRWQKADVVLIDNLQVLHARRHFTPPRRILASLFKC